MEYNAEIHIMRNGVALAYGKLGDKRYFIGKWNVNPSVVDDIALYFKGKNKGGFAKYHIVNKNEEQGTEFTIDQVWAYRLWLTDDDIKTYLPLLMVWIPGFVSSYVARKKAQEEKMKAMEQEAPPAAANDDVPDIDW